MITVISRVAKTRQKNDYTLSTTKMATILTSHTNLVPNECQCAASNIVQLNLYLL